MSQALLSKKNENQFDNMIDKVSDISHSAMEASKEGVEKSVVFAKKYPIHTAIGAGVVGFATGFFVNKFLK